MRADEIPPGVDPLEALGIERDPVIEAYKKDVDRTLLRENLKLNVDERLQKMESFQEFTLELRRAVQEAEAARGG